MNNEEDKELRREYRRKRRIRNQTIAYIVLVLLAIVICFAGFIGFRKLFKVIKNNNNSSFTASSQELADNDEADEDAVISTPDMETVVSSNEVTVSENVAASAAARAYIDSFSLEQKVASLFVITPESLTGVGTVTQAGEGTKNALGKYAVAGLMYSSKNVTGADEFKDMISNTKQMYSDLYGAPLWTFASEGGAVNTIAGKIDGVEVIPAMSSLGMQENSSAAALDGYNSVASTLSEYGVDVNVCPVCNISVSGNSFIGDNAFSDDCDVAGSMVKTVVECQKNANVISCIGAFPGEGHASANPANASATIDTGIEDMRSNEYIPFSYGIEAGSEMIIMSNAVVSAFSDEGVPCSFSSKAINDELRGELGYEGIVVSGRLDDAAVTSKYSQGEAAVMAINAGADIIMCPKNFEEAYNGVLDAVNNGVISADRLDEALMRIYTLKFEERN